MDRRLLNQKRHNVYHTAPQRTDPKPHRNATQWTAPHCTAPEPNTHIVYSNSATCLSRLPPIPRPKPCPTGRRNTRRTPGQARASSAKPSPPPESVQPLFSRSVQPLFTQSVQPFVVVHSGKSGQVKTDVRATTKNNAEFLPMQELSHTDSKYTVRLPKRLTFFSPVCRYY